MSCAASTRQPRAPGCSSVTTCVATTCRSFGASTPDWPCLDLPILDTLELSAIAFPSNPYHRLVKGYKLLSDSRNDPVKDARLTLDLLARRGRGPVRDAAQRPRVGCAAALPAAGRAPAGSLVGDHPRRCGSRRSRRNAHRLAPVRARVLQHPSVAVRRCSTPALAPSTAWPWPMRWAGSGSRVATRFCPSGCTARSLRFAR